MAGRDRGVSLVLFAIGLFGIFAVIALVLGGSVGYEAERNSQTASDAAALAATSTLRKVQTGSALPAQVYATAKSVAEANGSDTISPANCMLIDQALAVITQCSSASSSQMASASGVLVGSQDTRNVPFGKATNNRTIAGVTGAAATIQKLATGSSPFMVCSPAPGHPSPVITSSGEVIPSAIGKDYVLQGNPMKDGGRDCGNPSEDWRGWVEFENTFDIPGWWGTENGNKNGHIDRQLVEPNACGGQDVDVNDFTGCVLIVPLCLYGNGSPSNFQAYCVTFGAFRIVWNDNGPSMCSDENTKHICGRFLGAAIATSGQGTAGHAGVNDVVVIKLAK